MKVAVAFALLAACFAATYSASTVYAPDYAAVGHKVDDAVEIIIAAFNQIKIIANNDNSDVGSIISSKLDAAAVDVIEVIGRIHAAVAAQSLTAAQADGLISEIIDIVVGVLNDIQDELAQLSNGASNQITSQFYGVIATVESLAQEIYALLAQ
ncbi:unnamed protein product [Orchesella dallaii]|uniref:Uncharacterized protein n=1 Tax=Orchesella dallaii TaxID=48710 RepID=A0ABP1PL98_9HEXA